MKLRCLNNCSLSSSPEKANCSKICVAAGRTQFPVDEHRDNGERSSLSNQTRRSGVNLRSRLEPKECAAWTWRGRGPGLGDAREECKLALDAQRSAAAFLV
eukprot:4781852-Pleurochrysis_carterae.AAC.3